MGSPRLIPCGLLVCGTHVGRPRFIPCGLLVYGTHVGSPRFFPCGLLVYGTHVGSPRFIPYGIHVGSPRFIPCGLLVYGTHVGFPDGSHLGCIWGPFSPSGTQSSFAPWHPSGAMLVNVVLYLNLTYFWYLLTLHGVGCNGLLPHIPGNLRIDPGSIEQNKHFV